MSGWLLPLAQAVEPARAGGKAPGVLANIRSLLRFVPGGDALAAAGVYLGLYAHELLDGRRLAGLMRGRP